MKRKKSNGILLTVIAVPVILCVVMLAVIYMISKKGDAPVMPNNGESGEAAGEISNQGEVPSPDTEPDEVPDITGDGDNTSVDTPSAGRDEPSGNTDNTPDTPVSPSESEPVPPDSSRLPETRPTVPEVPSTQEPVDEIKAADASEWNLLLVNPWNKIPEGYTVELASYNASHSVDARIIDDLKDMMDAMKSEGLSPIVCSSFRTHEKQQSLFDRQVQAQKALGLSDEEARKEAGKAVAVPGTSEHETGLAVDSVALSYQILDEKQEQTDEQKLLIKNCYDYGFILRYPNGKSDITGIIYEPWHYRYVGKTVAAEIRDSGLTLEEWVAKNK